MTRAVYNATPPTKADKAQFELQCDEHGYLRVTLAGGGGFDVDATIVGPLGTQAAAAAVGVTLSTENLARFPASLGAKTGAASFSIVPASDASFAVTGPQTNAEFLAANRCTVTKTSVNSAAISTQLLASNANRKSLTVVNTDANILYIDTSGGTATNACIPVASGASWASSGAVPTNAITGIWAADGAGAATIFEGA